MRRMRRRMRYADECTPPVQSETMTRKRQQLEYAELLAPQRRSDIPLLLVPVAFVPQVPLVVVAHVVVALAHVQ